MMKTLIKRIYAGLIDVMIASALVYFLYAFTFYYNIKLGDFSLDKTSFVSEYSVIYALVMLVYFIICELFSQSFGKKAFSLKINYGKKVKTAKCLRPFLKLITLYIWPLIIPSLFFKKNLLYYDYILGTDIEKTKYERGDLR